MSRPALFLDRDGVINIDHGYVIRPEDFKVIDGVFNALRLAAKHGYDLIIVTNQSGIGRGYFTQADYDVLKSHIVQLFGAENITFTGIYHCPHHPDAGCACRKPKPGMILQAAHDHKIDLEKSIMIGDKISDTEAGKAAHVGNIELATPGQKLEDILEKFFRR